MDTGYRCNGLLFQAADYADDARMPSHSHELAHLVFSLHGQITHISGKHTHLFEPRTLVFLPAGEPHANRFHEGVKTLHVVLEPQWLERFQQDSTRLDAPAYYPSGPPTWLAMRLYREFQHRDALTPLVLEGLMLELLATISRVAAGSMGSPAPRWLRQTRDLLHDRFTDSLSLDATAAAVGVHPSHLMEGFRRHYHCTVGEYVRRLRVEYATHLLSTSEMSASQIAHAAGFADQSHFCRTFKQLIGMTPTQFRQLSR